MLPRIGILTGNPLQLMPETLLWKNTVITNGGSVSNSRLLLINQFITNEKKAGLWSLTDDYWGLWAENSIQALTSLKQRRLSTAVNSPTFTTDRNYAFNGTTNYIDTGFIPSTHANAMVINSIHAEVYERTNVSGSTSPAGVSSTLSRNINVFTRTASNTVVVAPGGTGATYNLSVATSQGLTQYGKNGATGTDVYAAKNGVDLAQVSPQSSVATSLPINSFYIGGCDVSGTLSFAKAASVGYVSLGASLNSVQRLARYNNVLTWATAIGANV